MTSQAEQWSLIICVIWPILSYLLLGALNYSWDKMLKEDK